MKSFRQMIGSRTERTAKAYLEEKGLHCVDANFSSRFGEIDLIMKDNDTLVFVEVRFRKKDHYGSSIESVCPKKQDRIIKTATFYLQCTGQLHNAFCRFDIVGRDANNNLLWIQDAFQVQSIR